jgi:hypothetical protein
MSRVVKSAGLAFAVGAVMLAGAGAASADSGAQGVAYGSPGVLSGNVVQIPVHVPVNACGNTVNVIGLLNPAFGNSCSNGSHGNWHQGRWGMQDSGMNHEGGHRG